MQTQYVNAMSALQVQDKSACSKAYKMGRDLYAAYDKENATQQEKIILETYVDVMQVALLNIETIKLGMEHRNSKYIEVSHEALSCIDEAQANLEKLDKGSQDIQLFYDLFAFIFRYFELVFQGSLYDIQARFDIDNGKFVNLIDIKKEAIKTFMLIDEHAINQESPHAPMMNSLRDYVAGIAESKEMEIEALIDKQKDIQFLNPTDNQLFVIHGHGMNYLQEFKDLLKNKFDIEPLILIEEPNQGKTVIEKIEDYGKNCAFAFAILTPDDLIKKDGEEYFQARPNVLFELGWFIGRYGRSKVRIIKKRGTELPSDFGGLLTLNFENSIDELFEKIKLELVDLGIVKPTEPKL